MPELPEVEIIKRHLAAQITNSTLQAIVLRRQNLRFEIPKHLVSCAKNQLITSVRRRSKYLLLDLANGQTIIIHLGMSGRLFFTNTKRSLDKHDHALFEFDDGKHLRFRDPRRFGILSICETSKLSQHKFFLHLGIEPLDANFHADSFYDICQKSKSPIKNLMMNAKHVVGVGNIYASEALFCAGIHPKRAACTISRQKIAKLCECIKGVLRLSIKMGGTSFRDYVGVNEEPGLHQILLKVYNKFGQPCAKCRKNIKKIVQAGRSSFYCSNCQG